MRKLLRDGGWKEAVETLCVFWLRGGAEVNAKNGKNAKNAKI